ncbi:transmembrane protein 92 [Sorex fumeus]|uniref:transmembrane protein 92 n=1 Tax=Sorex fumeus TaxID=62283 RepID=UPI0024AC9E65|nr:transmembrane protein 92 [Sorex fumeus]
MPYAGLPGFPPTLLLGLLACLPQVAAVCDPELFITATFSIGLLLCLCGVVKSFCCKCKDPEPEMGLTMDYCMDPQMTHPRPPPEEVRAPFPEYPPPYHEVIRRPDQDLPHREPPPPYSFRPEGYWGTSRGIDNPAF